MGSSGVDGEARPPRGGSRFPGAAATPAIVTVLVWIAALFIPPGVYQFDQDGSPIPGTYAQIAPPLTAGERVQQLILAPVNGVYGLRNLETGKVDTETVGRLFGQIGIIAFIMAIGAFISVSFATRALQVAVAALAMPLLAPLADFAGVSRATTITAWITGHGLALMISPTSVVLVGGLAIAGVGYDRYLRFAWPLLLALFAVSTTIVAAAAGLG